MADAVSCAAILVSNGRLSERSTKTNVEVRFWSRDFYVGTQGNNDRTQSR